MKNIDTLILAGGKSTRLDYVDKLDLKINNEKILDLVIQNGINNIYVVGDKRPTKINVTWINDLVKNGGPGVGVWSGLQEINSEYVLILAGDQPFIGHYVTELCQKAVGNGSWLVNSEGMGNPLASCVKVSALKSSLEETGGVNVSLRQILGKMDLVPITVTDEVVQDLDTWADVAKVMRESGNMTDAWIKNIAKKLDLNHEVLDVEKILDLTRDVAHNVERKVAPLTTFLLGYAAGKGNLAKKEIEELVEKINQSVKEWQEKK